ncbi:MAG: RNA methyltransferase [Clostridiales bacterium]|nr:RNA methyltransferase [Clostridiales bacterium]
MEVITSISNAIVKRINKLKQKKYRDEAGEFIVEGLRNVRDTAEATPQSVVAVILGESSYKKYGAEFSAFSVSVVSDAIVEKLSDAESSQGVISINRKKQSEFPSGRCVLLDRVRDPGNVGTILRTAVAAGYDVVLDGCCDIYSPKVVRSGMSAVLKCRISEDISVAELKAAGYEIIVADMNGEDIFDAAKPIGKYCIVIGNEADGVSDEIANAADRIIAIPQSGVESLNAAVAAGVMMFVLGRK